MADKTTEYISIEEVEAKWDELAQFSTRPDPEKFPIYPEGYVFDEEKSVRWNREERDRANELARNEKERLRQLSYFLQEEATNLVTEYIIQETQVNRKQAYILWSFVYEEYHAHISDTFNKLYEFIELHNNIARAASAEEDN